MSGIPSMGQIWLLLFLTVVGLVLSSALIALLRTLVEYRDPTHPLSKKGLRGFLQQVSSRTSKISSVWIATFLVILALAVAS